MTGDLSKQCCLFVPSLFKRRLEHVIVALVISQEGLEREKASESGRISHHWCDAVIQCSAQ